MAMFLLDVRPDPVPVAGVAALVLGVIVVLVLVALLIVGFVLLLKFLQRRKAGLTPVAGGVATQSTNPNQ
jgi:hypothetical protein